MLPPATPPLSSSTSQPGLFTSKDLITKQQNKKNSCNDNVLKEISWKRHDFLVCNHQSLHFYQQNSFTKHHCIPMSLALDVKSLTGTGIFLQMYSQMTSMLYLSCAEIGTTGAPSAIVPKKQNKEDVHVSIQQCLVLVQPC